MTVSPQAGCARRGGVAARPEEGFVVADPGQPGALREGGLQGVHVGVA
jgi:hypothetical protein